ncbi:MAG: UMP kinase [Patescibacteria group bacterium]|nr:MAG: UMP kinase [Patescibacteria group bacterium]
METPHKRATTIVIKLSGAALSGDGNKKYSEVVFDLIAGQIKSLQTQGHRVALILGGGNLFRGKDLSAELSIKRSTADYVGMLATVQNALVLRDYFESKGIATRVSSSIPMPQICERYVPRRTVEHLKEGRLVIFAGGLGVPFFTTDSLSAVRALEIGADVLIMAKDGVDGVYSADPDKDTSAVKIDTISASEALARDLKVADASAIALARDHNLTIRVVSIKDIWQALGSDIGSTVTPD